MFFKKNELRSIDSSRNLSCQFRCERMYDTDNEELRDYCIWLGMDPETEGDLMWIAEEALRTPLPAHWEICHTEGQDDIFYFNTATGESSWDHPCDSYFRDVYLQRRRACSVGASHNSTLFEGALIEETRLSPNETHSRKLSNLIRDAEVVQSESTMWGVRKSGFLAKWRVLTASIACIERDSRKRIARISTKSIGLMQALLNNK